MLSCQLEIAGVVAPNAESQPHPTESKSIELMSSSSTAMLPSAVDDIVNSLVMDTS